MSDTEAAPAPLPPLDDAQRALTVNVRRFLERMTEDYLSDDHRVLAGVRAAGRVASRVPHLEVIGVWLRRVSLTLVEVRTRELAATPAALLAACDLLDHGRVPGWLLYASPHGHLLIGRVHGPAGRRFWRGEHSTLCRCAEDITHTAADAASITAGLYGQPPPAVHPRPRHYVPALPHMPAVPRERP